MWNPGLDLSTTFDIDTSWLSEGRRTYELTNHLGNVLATISDKRIPVYENDGTTVAYYDVDLLSAVDYYPFGMQMPGRVFNGGGYRYGFNGKENDNEVKGEGSQQDYGMRVYDPRLGRFLSVDPITKQYPELTPCQFATNMPIWAVDLDGLEAFKVTQRSFAPWRRFGDAFGTFKKSFKGDDRGFSLFESGSRWDVMKATARLHSMAKFTLGTDGVSEEGHFASITTGYKNFVGRQEKQCICETKW
ncbi:hypothetical protein COR50_14200 [Chitinophaga caeni]|uniref:RHS repeat-associated core domain-containing protein n=1 Tax=Chitinophaga caeni TaxID=2029983 RepID=A0A291QWG2_9BACT|nr:hypothetical protein COR50_14200 [Chitinophaga caeni]